MFYRSFGAFPVAYQVVIDLISSNFTKLSFWNPAKNNTTRSSSLETTWQLENGSKYFKQIISHRCSLPRGYSTATGQREPRRGQRPRFIISESRSFVMQNAVLQLRKPTEYRSRFASFLRGSHSVWIYLLHAVTVQCMNSFTKHFPDYF